jgi:uncharacterized protein (TIGR02145 family)
MKNLFKIPRLILLIILIGSALIPFNSCKKQEDIISDIDGNVYNAITIGTQTWMKENLKTTKYNDGTYIPLVTDNTAWSNLSTVAYCWYDNDKATYKSTYGALYNWFTVNTGKLCPLGWHVPTDAEWTILSNYLGDENVTGNKLKEAGTLHWNTPNTGATNETGFTGFPGGDRVGISFNNVGMYGTWWSASVNMNDSEMAWYREMYYGNQYLRRGFYLKRVGFSVRCIKD